MKTITNPLKWLQYSKMLSEVDKKIRCAYGEINMSNIEAAATAALEVLTKEAKLRNLIVEEYAYILYSMNEKYIAYQAIFSLEMLYGTIPKLEREKIVDRVAEIHYKLDDGFFVDEFEYAKIYRHTYQRLNLLMPL